MECRITDEVVKNPHEGNYVDASQYIPYKAIKKLEKSVDDLKQSHYNFQSELLVIKKELNHAVFAITCLGFVILGQSAALYFL